MSKEEKIKEAWKNFPMVKYDSNSGFAISYCINGVTDILDDPYGKIEWECIESDLIKWRPLELKGIETNNGWIKIESEEDIPTEERLYWLSSDKGWIKDSLFPLSSIKPKFLNGTCTHYQPIEIPKERIY